MHATAAAASPHAEPVRISRGQLAVLGAGAGVAAGAVMAATLMIISEIASDPTFQVGIDSSTWTPLTGITAFLFGPDAFHGDFHVLSIAFGLAVHLAFAALFGVVGLALIVAALSARPGLLWPALVGFSYALFVQVFFLNLVINSIQEQHTVYEALPQWAWWVAHAAYGVALGVVGGLLLGSRPYAR